MNNKIQLSLKEDTSMLRTPSLWLEVDGVSLIPPKCVIHSGDSEPTFVRDTGITWLLTIEEVNILIRYLMDYSNMSGGLESLLNAFEKGDYDGDN